MKERSHRAGQIMERNLMEKKTSLCVTSVTILDTVQGIREILKVRMEPIKEEIHMYVNYIITSDTN